MGRGVKGSPVGEFSSAILPKGGFPSRAPALSGLQEDRFHPHRISDSRLSYARLSLGLWNGFGRAEISLNKVIRLPGQHGSKANGDALFLGGVMLGCNSDICMAKESRSSEQSVFLANERACFFAQSMEWGAGVHAVSSEPIGEAFEGIGSTIA